MKNNILFCKEYDNRIRWNKKERLNHLFEYRCDDLPGNHLAVISENASFTYRELDNRAKPDRSLPACRGHKSR